MPKHLTVMLLSVMLLGVAIRAAAEERPAPDGETTVNLELVMTASRGRENVFRSPRSVSVVNRAALEEKTPRSLPDALSRVPGVAIQKTTHGHGVPIIRGFIGRQNLILVDGLRLNNAVFRSGPVQYFNTIDQFSVDRIEVVRGPGSVLYGSDAMGGVVNVLTRRHEDFSEPFSMARRLIGTYSGADGGMQGHFDFDGNYRNFGFTAGGSVKNFGDLRAGGNLGTGKPTGYGEKDLNIALNYKDPGGSELTLAHQYVNQENVPRYDKYSTARGFIPQKNQLFLYDPQRRSLTYLSCDAAPGIPGVDDLHAKVMFQRQEEGRREQQINSTTRSDSYDIADTAGATLQSGTPVGNMHRLVYGTEFYKDRIYSAKENVNTLTGAVTPKPLESAFPNGSEYSTFGVYLQDRITMTDRLTATLGGRYSIARVDTFYRAPLTGAWRNQFDALTGSAGMDYLLNPSHTLFINISEAFRAPNLDDTVGMLSSNQGVNIPNYGLKPEKSVTYETGIKRQGKLSGSLSVFMASLSDLIVTQPGTWMGLSFFDANGNGIREANEYPVRQQANAGKGTMGGAEMEWDYALAMNWDVYGTLSWMYGDNTSDNVPLSRIPPLNGTAGCRWHPGDTYWAGAYTDFADKQDRLAPADMTDSRIQPGGTPGWATMNLQGGISFSKGLKLTAALINIFDTPYRVHGSGLDAPGRNVSVTVSSVF